MLFSPVRATKPAKDVVRLRTVALMLSMSVLGEHVSGRQDVVVALIEMVRRSMFWQTRAGHENDHAPLCHR